MAYQDLFDINISFDFVDDSTTDSSFLASGEEEEFEYFSMDMTRQINLRSKIVKVKSGTTKKFIMAEERPHKMISKHSAQWKRIDEDMDADSSDSSDSDGSRENENEMNSKEPAQAQNKLAIESGLICDDTGAGPSNEIEPLTATIENESVHSAHETGEDRENDFIQPQPNNAKQPIGIATPAFGSEMFVVDNDVGTESVAAFESANSNKNEFVPAQLSESGKF